MGADASLGLGSAGSWAGGMVGEPSPSIPRLLPVGPSLVKTKADTSLELDGGGPRQVGWWAAPAHASPGHHLAGWGSLPFYPGWTMGLRVEASLAGWGDITLLLSRVPVWLGQSGQ